MSTPTTANTLDATALAVHPEAVWRQLRTVDYHLLNVVAYLARNTTKTSKSGAAYCTPGRAWLAKRLGVSIRTITRHTSRLHALGIVTRTQRRPISGKWQTNLYAIGGRAVWIVARTLRIGRAFYNRGTSEAHQTPSERGIDARGQHRSALRALIQKLEARARGD